MQVRCDPKPPTASSVSPRPSLPFANRVPAAAARSSSLIAGKAMVSADVTLSGANGQPAGEFMEQRRSPRLISLSPVRRLLRPGVPPAAAACSAACRTRTTAPCCSCWSCRRSTLCSRRGCCHAAPPPPGRRASVGGGGAPARDALLPRLAMEQQQQLPGVHPHSVFMVKSEPAGKGL